MHVPSLLRPLLTWGLLAVVASLASLAVVRLLDADRHAVPPSAVEQRSAAEQVALRVLRSWDERRAAAYAEGDVAALRALYARGSGAGERDVRLLRSYVERGLVVEGLRQQLLQVSVVDAAPHRLTVRVRDRLAAATVVVADRQLGLPQDRPSTNDVVLVRQDADWLVWSVDPARRGGRSAQG
jgi:hypothetical protein